MSCHYRGERKQAFLALETLRHSSLGKMSWIGWLNGGRLSLCNANAFKNLSDNTGTYLWANNQTKFKFDYNVKIITSLNDLYLCLAHTQNLSLSVLKSFTHKISAHTHCFHSVMVWLDSKPVLSLREEIDSENQTLSVTNPSLPCAWLLKPAAMRLLISHSEKAHHKISKLSLSFPL